MRELSVHLHRALIKSKNNISIPPWHWGISERLNQSQMIFAAFLLLYLAGEICRHIFRTSTQNTLLMVQSSQRNRALTKGCWKFRNARLPLYITLKWVTKPQWCSFVVTVLSHFFHSINLQLLFFSGGRWGELVEDLFASVQRAKES